VLLKSPEQGRAAGWQRGSSPCGWVRPEPPPPGSHSYSISGELFRGDFTAQNEQDIIHSASFLSWIARYPNVTGCMVCVRKFPPQTNLSTDKIFQLLF